MLTAKIISPNGNEWLIEAVDVTRTYPQTDDPKADPPPDTVWISRTSGEITPITEGVVFVMNASGATVAKYDLRPPQP